MHRIIAALLRDFVDSYQLQEMNEAEQFERLVNHCVVTPEVVESYDLADVTTTSGDDGLDGVAVVIDQEVMLSREDCEETLTDGRRNHDAKIILIQAKTSENIDLGEVLKFHAAIERFCLNFKDKPKDEIEANAKDVYMAAVDKAGSIRDGKLSLVIRYSYTGRYISPDQVERARSELTSRLADEGYFAHIDYEILDREGIGHAFQMTAAPIEARVDAFSVAALPKISGVEEAYLAVVPAKKFVENMLSDDTGRLRMHVFEENVRAFLGPDNPVNNAIGETIRSDESHSRFPVLLTRP